MIDFDFDKKESEESSYADHHEEGRHQRHHPERCAGNEDRNEGNIKTKKIAMMQELRNSGHSAQEVADLLGCSPNYVYQHTKIDAEMRKRLFVRRVTEWREAALRKRKEYYVPIMLELRKQGYSNVEIGQKTGFAMTTVKKYIGKNPDEIILARVRALQAARRFRERAVRNQAERDAKEMRDAA